jgi:two-component system, LuxR family, response regulator FixJ
MSTATTRPSPSARREHACVHIVDDDASFRRAIGRLLQAEGFQVRQYASAGEFLISSPEHHCGCILLDIRMPGPNGLELQDALRQRDVQLPIIFLSGHGDIPMSVRAMKAGALDFLTKPIKRPNLLNAVRVAVDYDTSHRAHREQIRTCQERYATLTPRERQVFQFVVTGRLNKQIASELGTSQRTVKAHRSQVMRKMQVQSVAELVHVAEQIAPGS